MGTRRAASPYVVDFRRSFTFPVPPEELWAAIEHVERFERWWAWLQELEVEGNGLRSGAVLRGVVKPPLPYRMKLRVRLEECVAPRRIAATVSGDLEGHASITLEPDGDGTRAAAAWTVEMMQPPMRVAARWGRPLLAWGHDRVVDATVARFRRVLGDRRRHPRRPPSTVEDGDER